MNQIEQKKEGVMNVYNACKKIAVEYLEEKEYEAALGITSAIANLMYKTNLLYSDDILEMILETSAKEWVNPDLHISAADRQNVVFYDEFGFDSRGLATIYLNAMVQAGYHVIYVTRWYREGKIQRIVDILEQDKESHILYINRGLYKHETEELLKIAKKYQAGSLFVYDMPQGIVGSMAAYFLKTSDVMTYKVNLTDHAFWLGTKATDYFIEFRDYGASISKYYRNIDEHKLIKLPYYSEIDEDLEFQGFPSEIEGKPFIFSGGALYKTLSEDNLYYEIIDEILGKYPDMAFWYAGQGDDTKLKLLLQKYPDRAVYTRERNDLYQILKRCLFYYSTYPISGGLMGQFAVSAGKVPITLIHNDEARLLINNAESINCEFDTKDNLMIVVEKLITDEDYRLKAEKNTKDQLISPDAFQRQLSCIITQQKSDQKIRLNNIDIVPFTELYMDNFTEDMLKSTIVTKRTKDLQKIKNFVENESYEKI